MTEKSSAAKKFIFLLFIFATSGCSFFQPTIKEAPPVPDAFQHQAAGKAAALPIEPWWQSFNDPQLDQLITAAFAGNLELEQAFARYQQSLALVQIQAAAKRPQLNAEGQMHRDRQPGYLDDTTENNYRLSLAASFEVDLWQKLEKRRQARALEATASEEDIKTMYLGLSCQVADLYYLLLEQQSQLTLTEETIASFDDTLKRVELRYRQGLVPALDVYQSRQNLAAARARKPGDQANLDITLQALAVALGRFNNKEDWIKTRPLPDDPVMFTAGVPANLLQQRPDIKSAWLRLRASDARLAAAIADRFPTIVLTGSFGKSQTAFGTTPVIGTFWQLLAGFTQPLIDGGRRRAEVERQRAVVRELLARYQQKVITAVKEVEDALARNHAIVEQISHLKQQEFATRQSLRLATERYLQGITDYLPVLTAQQFQFSARRQLLEAQQKLMAARVGLVRALGGQWMAEALKQHRPLTINKGSSS